VGALVAALVCTTPVRPAEADPEPDGEIARAHKTVRDRTRQLGEAQAQLAQAQARLEDLQADAELLIEDYNGELVRLRTVKLAYQQSAGRLRQAERQVDAAREPVAAMVAGSYGEIELSQPLVAMIVDSGGLDGYLHRASMLNHIGVEQTATLQRLRDYEQVYSILRGQAERAYAAQRETTERVEAAKSAAENAVAAQVEQTAQVKRQKEEISRRLDAARSRVERLRRAREEARRRAAVSAEGLAAPAWAVEWAKQASSGQGGVAVQWALTQLGKPYVWAAAGPSSSD
jgi:hypothetical protein